IAIASPFSIMPAPRRWGRTRRRRWRRLARRLMRRDAWARWVRALWRAWWGGRFAIGWLALRRLRR
ncbi:hypothetical protein N9L68_09175, partial [bacterium]|nr:hypothetical protein [bacterium]